MSYKEHCEHLHLTAQSCNHVIRHNVKIIVYVPPHYTKKNIHTIIWVYYVSITYPNRFQEGGNVCVLCSAYYYKIMLCDKILRNLCTFSILLHNHFMWHHINVIKYKKKYYVCLLESYIPFSSAYCTYNININMK